VLSRVRIPSFKYFIKKKKLRLSGEKAPLKITKYFTHYYLLLAYHCLSTPLGFREEAVRK